MTDRETLIMISDHIMAAHTAARNDKLVELTNALMSNDVRRELMDTMNTVADKTSLAFRQIADFLRRPPAEPAPIPMRIHCPLCGTQHIDEGEFVTRSHTSHTCQNQACGLTWKVANVPTVGVRFLPGTNNATNVDGAR